MSKKIIALVVMVLISIFTLSSCMVATPSATTPVDPVSVEHNAISAEFMGVGGVGPAATPVTKETTVYVKVKNGTGNETFILNDLFVGKLNKTTGMVEFEDVILKAVDMRTYFLDFRVSTKTVKNVHYTIIVPDIGLFWIDIDLKKSQVGVHVN